MLPKSFYKHLFPALLLGLARDRTQRHPAHSYLFPFERADAMWFTPRIALLPYPGTLWPLGDCWHQGSAGFEITVSRYLLTCEALSSTREEYAFTVFERLFKERGLPANIPVIRSKTAGMNQCISL